MNNGNMSGFSTVLKALFKNHYRFGDGDGKNKRIGYMVLIGLLYLIIVGFFIFLLITFKPLLFSNGQQPQYDALIAMTLYMAMLLTAAMVVLIFGVIFSVNVLYLSKDTDFYSTLPIKSSTLFAAKLSFVYLSESAFSCAVLVPIMITLGVVAKLWWGYYVISLFALLFMPALPLFLAVLVAIPIMFIASKLKHRNIISLIFYMLLFGGGMAVYMFFITSASDIVVDENTVNDIIEMMNVMTYILLPYTALSAGACGYMSFNLSFAPSTAVNLLLFFGISAVLMVIIVLLSKLTYSQAVKANNQTYNEKAKKGSFKASGSTKALVKREYKMAFRNTQTAFQCFMPLLLPIFFAVVLGIVFNNALREVMFDPEVTSDPSFNPAYVKMFILMMTYGVLLMVMGSTANGAFTAFSREGTGIASLKTMPIGINDILKAKLLAWGLPSVCSSLIAAIVAAAFGFEPMTFVLGLFAFILLSADYAVFGLLWDLSKPKLKWTDPMQAIKRNTHATIAIFLSMAVGFLMFMAVIVMSSFDSVTDTAFIAVFWSVAYAGVLIFAIVNILLYRRAKDYYNRIEI